MKPLTSTTSQPTNKKRIGYMLRMYPRFSQTFVVNEILELENQGVDLRIASLRLPNEGVFHESATRVRARVNYFNDRFIGNVRKHVLTQAKLLRKQPGQYFSAMRLIQRHQGEKWFELAQAAELLRWVRKNKIDHVHIHFGTDEATVALLAHMLGNISYSLTVHAFDIFRDNVDKRLLKDKINASRFTVTVCESNRQYMVKQLPGLDASKIKVLYNGIDATRFTPTGKARTPMTIFSVGRLIEKKGFIDLIHAVDILQRKGLPLQCEIAGEGREQRTLQRAIKDLGLAQVVKLIGSLEQNEVRQKMQEASCFALPCVRAKDGNVDALPTVLLESLACGCPTVSTILSGIPEIIEDGRSGLLVEPGDVEGLANAIEKILVDHSLAMSISNGGQDRVRERFSVNKNVARLRNLLCENPSDSPTAESTSTVLGASVPPSDNLLTEGLG